MKDEQFVEQLEPHRRAITLHCYRMLGSLQDAEEVAQESLIRAWQRFGELRSSNAARAWLYKIATNACLDFLKARRRRTLPHMLNALANPTTLGPPANEELWIEPAPDALVNVPENPEARVSLRESVSLAFITAIHYLSARQRAVLLLVDVLGWRPQEAAQLLETSVASVNSLLQRARRSMETRPVAPPDTSSSDEAALLRRYIATWESGDLDAFTALLAEDVILSMPPLPAWFSGRANVVAFLSTVLPKWPGQFRLLPTRSNGGPAVAVYTQRASGLPHEAAAITLLTVRNGRVAELVRFALPRLFSRFGLADHVDSSPASPDIR